MDRIVDGDVQQDAHNEWDMPAVTRDLTVSEHEAGSRPQAEEPRPAKPPTDRVVVGDTPRQPPGFQLRPHLMAQLNRPGRGVSVLTGPEGVGKTQLAAAYARAKLEEGWRLVAWVNAGDSGSLLAGLASVADAAGLADNLEWDSADAGFVVRSWLEADGDRRLLVFDDAEDHDALRPFIPAGGAARVLITTTQQSAADLGTSLPVDVFSADEALAALVGRTGLDDQAGAAAVVAALEHLPLALALAQPVIAGQHVGYERYLDRLQAIPIDSSLTGNDGRPYPAGVAEAVGLALQAMRGADRTGMCGRVMAILALLSAAGARRELMHAAGQAGVLAGGGQRVAVGLVDRVLGWLSERSLLTFSLDGQTVILHRLVAQLIRNELASSDRLTAAYEAAAFALDAYSRALVGSPDRRAVREIPVQVAVLLEITAGFATEADEELARFLLPLRFMAFYHVLELGDSTSLAIAVGEPLTADLERLLGPDHPDTLNSRNSLAAAYLSADRIAEAIQLFEQTLITQQRMLGPSHPETLTSQNNLASAYQDAGRDAEAIRLYELTLEIRERLLGVGHPSTLNSGGNLGAAYLSAGRVVEAIPLLEQTLRGREQVLGPHHPDTRTSRRNLAKAYRDTGRGADAILLAGQTLAARESQPAASAAGKLRPAGSRRPPSDPVRRGSPAGFQRPPADPVRRGSPAGFRRPPADPVRQPLPDGLERPPAGLTDHSAGRTQEAPASKDVQYDRRIVTAIASGDPAGIALAYDRYAAALYGYCHWMLHDSADAAAALQDTFVIAVATLSDLPEPSMLRPWLFARARNACRHRSRTTSATRDEEATSANQRSDIGQRSGVVSARSASRPARRCPSARGASRPARRTAWPRSTVTEAKPNSGLRSTPSWPSWDLVNVTLSSWASGTACTTAIWPSHSACQSAERTPWPHAPALGWREPSLRCVSRLRGSRPARRWASCWPTGTGG
jgi:tetratricopeptide (TPR) repeat protein